MVKKKKSEKKNSRGSAQSTRKVQNSGAKKKTQKKKVSSNKKNISQKTIILSIVVILIIAGGIFFYYDQNSTQEVVATVNEEEITSAEVSEVRERYSQQGQSPSEEKIVEQIIEKELLLQEAKKDVDIPTNEEITATIEAQLAQQNLTIEEYKEQIEERGFSYEERFKDFKEQMILQKYIQEMFAEKNLSVSDEEVEETYDTYKQQSPEGIPSFKELGPQIRTQLEQQKQREAISSLIESLKSEAEIEYLIEFESKEPETLQQQIQEVE